MTKSTDKRTVRIQLDLSETELQAIEDYRFRLRLPNRSAAVRALLQTGLKDEGADNDTSVN